jgi:hypothetical protein
MNTSLYTVLKQRTFRNPSENLAHRIITKARYLPQQQPTLLEQLCTVFYQEVSISQPFFKFASILALGAVIGISSLQYLQVRNYQSSASFLLDQDDTLFPGIGDTYE